MSAIRSDRMNEEVRKVLSEIIREMKDPRVLPVTSLTESLRDFPLLTASATFSPLAASARMACSTTRISGF